MEHVDESLVTWERSTGAAVAGSVVEIVAVGTSSVVIVGASSGWLVVAEGSVTVSEVWVWVGSADSVLFATGSVTFWTGSVAFWTGSVTFWTGSVAFWTGSVTF